MRTQRCKHCNGTYCYDEYGPIKECDCRKIALEEKIETAAQSWSKSGEADVASDSFKAGAQWAIDNLLREEP